MARKRIKGTKYNRVTKQQKYIFLKLCISEKQSIHQAAFHSGIHYSTAKTILFFHKKHYKNYTSYFIHNPEPQTPVNGPPRAHYSPIPIDLEDTHTSYHQIQIISHTYDKAPANKASRKLSKDSTSDVKQEEGGPDGVKVEEVSQNEQQCYYEQPSRLSYRQEGGQLKRESQKMDNFSVIGVNQQQFCQT